MPWSLDKRFANEKVVLSIGAALSAYWVFCIIFGSLTALSLAVDLKRSHFSAVSLIVVGVLIGFLIWLRAFRIQITNGILCYRSLLNGVRSIAISDIDRIETKIGSPNAFGPFAQLVISSSLHNVQSPLVINMKVFSREDLGKLRSILRK